MYKTTILLLTAVVVLGLSQNIWGQNVGTVFTYQGRLSDGDSPALGEYDFEFNLFNHISASGVGYQVGGTVVKENVEVEGGTFTVLLDFGDVFDGQKRWLEIGVRAGELAGSFSGCEPPWR